MEHLKSILFVDIETVPEQPDYALLTESMQKEWDKKSRLIKLSPDQDTHPDKLFGEKAGVYSEFAKVVCIGIGSLQQVGGKWQMRLKSLTNDDEKELLNDFVKTLSRFQERYKEVKFCGHNIKEFDIPFLCRRMIINNIALPASMQLQGKKPWEISHIDTMELWRFGDYKNFTSLSLLATVLGIPSPKTDMDGSMVAGAYWRDNALKRIGEYCLLDVLTSARVYLRLAGINNVDPEPIFVND